MQRIGVIVVTMTDKIIIVVIVVIVVFLTISFAVHAMSHITETRENARIQEERQQSFRLWLMMRHVEEMMFEFRAIEDGEKRSLTWVSAKIGDPHSFFTDVVFVYNSAEAQYFPYNVVVAWPSENHYTEGMLTGINLLLSPENIPVPYYVPIRFTFTMEDFGLTYPLTITDLIDNWDKVFTLWANMDVEFALRDAARQYPHPWTIQPYHHQLE